MEIKMNRREFLKTGLEGIVLASALPKLAEADEERLVWKLNIGFG